MGDIDALYDAAMDQLEDLEVRNNRLRDVLILIIAKFPDHLWTEELDDLAKSVGVNL